MRTFAGISSEYAAYDTSKIVLQPILYDGTSTWGKGADKSLEAFLDASENMELYDIETDSEVFTEGIHLLDTMKDFQSPEDVFSKVIIQTRQIISSGKFPTFLGGEHSISIGIIEAMREVYQNLTVLQLDAHADLRPLYGGTEFNHACAMYRASLHANLLQVGIRSMDSWEKEYMDVDKTVFADEVLAGSDWVEDTIKQMTDNIYITIDLDVFDPSVMPATGTPEPGGLSWYDVTKYLRRVFAEKNVVGFDIVEFAPLDGRKDPDFMVSKLYYKLLSYKYYGR